jgi:hypothetical protein
MSTAKESTQVLMGRFLFTKAPKIICFPIMPPRGGLKESEANAGYKHAVPLALKDKPDARLL